jgi:hypothetical protein
VILDDLAPYQSVVLAEIREDEDVDGFFEGAMRDLEEEVEDTNRYEIRSQLREQTSEFDKVGILHYLERRPATWSADRAVIDELNQLIILVRRRRIVALYCSDQAKRVALSRRFSRPGIAGLGQLEKIPAARLNAAFVHGTARTLWLTGTHKRVSVKADNKVLTGIDLRDALDPLEDQTFHFTSARCQPDPDDPDRPIIGASPHASSVWKGLSRQWDEFAAAIQYFFDKIERVASPVDSPFPILAVETTDFGAVSDAFDIGILPPDILASVSLGHAVAPSIVALSDQTAFEIIKTTGASVAARVDFDGVKVGDVFLRVEPSPPDAVNVTVEGKAALGHESRFAEVADALRNPDLLSIRFDSGHTLVDGAIYVIRHRDIPFDGYEWIDLSRYKVTKEKPPALTAELIGHEDSLFSWVRSTWGTGNGERRRWLACDDGAGEVADFIHLDAEADPPLISLIHVKGAKSSSPNRGLSVSAYEVVVAQAVKNLRHLDQALLGKRLKGGLKKQVGKLVWRDGKSSTRDEMIDALAALPASHARKVVILQPHLTKGRFDSARIRDGTADAKRLAQLDTLLYGAEASCHGLGARLVVLGDETEAVRQRKTLVGDLEERVRKPRGKVGGSGPAARRVG